jgi:hypothetical protein
MRVFRQARQHDNLAGYGDALSIGFKSVQVALGDTNHYISIQSFHPCTYLTHESVADQPFVIPVISVRQAEESEPWGNVDPFKSRGRLNIVSRKAVQSVLNRNTFYISCIFFYLLLSFHPYLGLVYVKTL